jgi:hypothetical protein
MASTIKVDNIQNQCGANIINESANTITIGASGDTISLACGASQTGFGRTGTVDWDTTAKTSAFTAVSGNGYFVNTTSAAITMTLPASPSAGDIVAFKDYAGTFATNNLTIARNGSNLDGNAGDKVVSTNNQNFTMVYVDGTQGWIATSSGTGTIGIIPSFITATGGTVTCCGDYKIHTFTGPGTFTVCSVGNPVGSDSVDYLVVAGGGSGGTGNGGGGGGGAGGLRYSDSTYCNPSPSGGAAGTAIPVSAQGYPIVVGGGGSAISGPGGSPTGSQGNDGNNSSGLGITSAGGGGGGGQADTCNQDGRNGGSGGGGGGRDPAGSPGGTGNTPPVSPSQGNSGGIGGVAAPGVNPNTGGGGGGHSAVGGNAAVGPNGGPGGNGSLIKINGSCTSYAGGGGGNAEDQPAPNQGQGGTGGGGAAGEPSATAGTANTGGGGGGTDSYPGSFSSGAGGSGIVIIRYKYQ